MNKIANRTILIMFVFAFLLQGCSNPHESKVIQSFGNEQAKSLIANHNDLSEDAIRISEIKEIEKNHWFVLYQQKSENGLSWEPSIDSNFGMDIKNTAGDYLTSNNGYGMPALFASLEGAN
ncbi:hypothetical protein EHS13_07475 [Paenibacillus psychroresistens]|uniref:Lipoprotein n=1 Tax=Paenibacillus psychroresistens TaxID=1778678 RepID=A0A6B8RGS3_9BACL|nr:hypothetical protein [Paenibacillus psychroresistens]QGQ94733.1 hypothetical protein EHS13_07475 [Paenibacillus psychroresistens]